MKKAPVLSLLAGEGDLPMIAGFLALALLAELIRWRTGCETRRGVRLSFLPLLLVMLALTIPVALLGMRLAERVLKKQSAALR